MKKLFLLFSGLLLCAPAFGQAPNPIASVTGNITAQGSTCTKLVMDSSNSTITNCVSMQLPSTASTVSIVLAGTFSATVQFELSADYGNTWVSASVVSATATGTYTFAVDGFNGVRARASTYSSGTIVATITPSNGGHGSLTLTSPTVNGNYLVNYNVTGGVGVTPSISLPGIAVNPNSEGTCSGGTLAYNNRGSYIECTGGTTASYTIPLATGNIGANLPFAIFNGNTGILTISPTSPNTINGGTSETLQPNFMALVYQDNGSPVNWHLRKFESFAAAGNVVNATAQTASIATSTLCDVTVGQCGTAGYYTVVFSLGQGGTACGTPGSGGVSLQLTWTDGAGTVHSAVTIPVIDSSSTTAISPKMTFTTSNGTAFSTGSLNIFTNGSIIQYATTYTACSVGTGTYTVRAVVQRQY